jgi:hypothetical protein
MLSFVFPFTSIILLKMFLNIFFFNVHDIEVMTKKINFSMKMLPENTSLCLIMGHTKTRKLLLTELKTKHNVIVLRHHVIQLFT